MANSSSKGLTIGLVALVVVLALVFAIARHNNSQETATPEVAASVPAPTEKKADEAKPAADAKQSDKKADSGSGDELTSPSDENAQAKSAEAAREEHKEDKAADKTEDKKEEKSDAKADDKDKSLSSSDSLLAAPSSLEIDVDKAMAERSIGKDDAPVTMIEYFSLTCPHCAHFANDLLPKLKPLLIDTGKVRLIYRDYPLDTYAMKAALMARCADPDKYFDLIEVIFKNQERWVKNADPVKGLIQLGSLAGMNEDYIKACMANEELQSSILAKVQDAQKNYKLNSTPTFVFNNGAEIMSGDKEVEDFVNVVKKLTGK